MNKVNFSSAAALLRWAERGGAAEPPSGRQKHSVSSPRCSDNNTLTVAPVDECHQITGGARAKKRSRFSPSLCSFHPQLLISLKGCALKCEPADPNQARSRPFGILPWDENACGRPESMPSPNASQKWGVGAGLLTPCVRDPRKTEIVGILRGRPASWRDLFNSAGHSSAWEHLLGQCCRG